MSIDPIRPGIVSALVGPTRDFSGLGYRFHCALIKAGVQGVPRIQAYADTDGVPPTFTDHGAGCACVERDPHLSPGTARPSATGDVAEGTKPQETP